MEIAARRFAQIVAVLLFSIVTMQIVYFALSSGGAEINRMIIWTAEAVVFLGIAVLALVCLTRGPNLQIAWAAIAVSGVLNLVQAGMGLAMFGPVSEAGGAMAPAYQAILAGAFFLYFAGKFLFGFAAIVIGADLLGHGSAGKVIGALTVLAGLIAMVINLGAMAMGMTLVFAAGATGTAATLFLGTAIVMRARSAEQTSEATI